MDGTLNKTFNKIQIAVQAVLYDMYIARLHVD